MNSSSFSINIIFSLIDNNEIYRHKDEKQLYLFKVNEITTVEDMNNYLKRQIDSTFDYYFYFNNKNFYEGVQCELVKNLVQTFTSQTIRFIRKPQNISNLKQNFRATIAYPPENIQNNNALQLEVSNKVPIFSEMKNKSREFCLTNNYPRQQNAEIYSKSQFAIQENQQQNNRNKSNYLQIQNEVRKEEIVEKTTPNEIIAIQMDQIYQQVLSKCQERFDNLQQQINRLQNQDNDKEFKIKQLFANLENIKRSQESSYTKLLDSSAKNICEQIDEIKNKIVIQNKNINDFKEKIESQLQKFYQEIQNSNRLTPQRLNNSNSLSQSYIYNTQTEFNQENSLLQSQIQIRLSCQHQIEKEKLELIVQNAIIQGQEVNCQICENKVTASIIRQLGQIGNQYLEIQNSMQLNQLYQNLIKDYRHSKKVLKCQTNNCNFFCMLQQNQFDFQYFCPLCLTFSVFIFQSTIGSAYPYKKDYQSQYL